MSNKLNNLKKNNFINSNKFKEKSNIEDDTILQEYKSIVYKSYLDKKREEDYDIRTPIFLQEFYYSFYIALKIIKNYYSTDSCIVSLGESPTKMVMVQSFFYKDTYIKDILVNNGYPSNITFKYLPLSGLSSYAYPSHNKSKQNFAKRSLAESIALLESKITDYDILKFESYLNLYSVDPKSIIKNKQKYIFLDRVETYNTTATLFYIYYKITKYRRFTNEQTQEFINYFKLVGFDGKYDNNGTTRISNLKRLIDYLFPNLGTRKIFNFYEIILYQNELIKKIDEIEKKLPNKSILRKFIKLFWIPDRLINFISLPEVIFISSRCIKSFKISEIRSINEIERLNSSYYKNGLPIPKKKNKIKNEKNSNNCNLINFLFYRIFLRFKDDKSLENLIINLDIINEEKLSILSEESINPEIFNPNYRFTLMNSEIFNPMNSKIFNSTVRKLNNNPIYRIRHGLINSLYNGIFLKNTIFDSEKKYDLPFKESLLCLDFDETLGSFHINYSLYSRYLNMYKIDKQKMYNIQRKLLEEYHLRPNLNYFFQELMRMKNDKFIDKIYIVSRNNGFSNYNNYFKETISIIEDITNCKGLIDKIIPGIKLKNLNKISKDENFYKIYIVDDKCEHVVPSDKCIDIKPYVTYQHYSIFIDILRENDIDETIIEEIETQLKKVSNSNFKENNNYSYIKQYPQIKNFKNLYKLKNNEKIKKYDDDELLRVLELIKEYYKTIL
jgi:hypothetical protein